MYLVKATAKWRQNLLPIPVTGENAVKYPANPPHMISVPKNTANYLVSKGLAYVCNAYGEEISSDFDSVDKSKSAAVTKTVESARSQSPPEANKNIEKELIANTQLADEWRKDISEADLQRYQDAAIAFVSEKSKREISRVKWIAADTVTSLKEIEELNWESLSTVLDSRQTESLLKHIAKKSS